jgi:general secretion pathway protein M
MSARASWRAFRHTKTGRRVLFAGVNLLALVAVYLLFIEPVRRMIADGA